MRIHATGRFPVAERLRKERAALRPLPPRAVDAAGERTGRVPIDGYLRHAGSFHRAPTTPVHQRVELHFSRDEVWIRHRGQTVARHPRSYRPGTWLPAPVMRPAPPPAPAPAELPAMTVAPPELTADAELV